jgi:hypothetical protein
MVTEITIAKSTTKATTIAATTTTASTITKTTFNHLSCRSSCGSTSTKFAHSLDGQSVSFCHCDYSCTIRNDCCTDFNHECSDLTPTTSTTSVTVATVATGVPSIIGVDEDNIRTFDSFNMPECGPRIVDSEDADAAVSVTGDWQTQNKNNRVSKTSFMYAVADPLQDQTVEFRPRIDVTAAYEVFFGYRPSTTRVSYVEVTVVHATGSSTITLNQREEPDPYDSSRNSLYKSLGTFAFAVGAAGGTQGVFVDGKSAEPGYKLVIDAVKFVPSCQENGEWPSDSITATSLINVDPAAYALFVADGGGVGSTGGSASSVVASKAAEGNVAQVLYAVVALLCVIVVGLVLGVTRARSERSGGSVGSSTGKKIIGKHFGLHGEATVDMDWEEESSWAGTNVRSERSGSDVSAQRISAATDHFGNPSLTNGNLGNLDEIERESPIYLDIQAPTPPRSGSPDGATTLRSSSTTTSHDQICSPDRTSPLSRLLSDSNRQGGSLSAE